MFSYEHNRLRRGGREEPILEWRVWFRTPWGLAETLEEAKAVCKAREVDPDQAIIPIPVAMSQSMTEVFIND